MSGFERKESELRSSAELEQIQMHQNEFLSRNVAMVSSSSDEHGKKPGSNGSHLKGGSPGRFESTKQQPHSQAQLTGSNTLASIMKQCVSILNKLRTHPFGWVFNSPVDPVALQIPDYHTVIKHPMDLGTIKNKLSSGDYTSPLDFVADVRLTFANAMTYNPAGNPVNIMANQLSRWFESKWEPVERELAEADMRVKRNTEGDKSVLQPKNRKGSPVICNIAPEKMIPRVMDEERQLLGNRLQSMPEDMPYQLLDFFMRHANHTNEFGEEVIEVDIGVLSDHVLLELRKLLDDSFPEMQIGQNAKGELSEIKEKFEIKACSLLEGAYFCIGNKPVDEDVDIAGNDPPISSYPPVEIERDGTRKRGKCSSSSSSNSYSASSSGNDSDDRGATPAKTAKGNKKLKTVHDRDNGSVNGLDQPSEHVHPDPISAEADGCQYGTLLHLTLRVWYPKTSSSSGLHD